ncbi:hypothetical protein SASPL_116903 [Salvia splendens]|uniref:Uncharacterized protein n=1 Tax=Salvia splendens TaxID=180675 RepID=A0A8X8ZVT9_SALSN|nr:hypothetical protein SASPL_116903 [Salvia splendens]
MMASSSSALRISITLQSTRKPLFPSILTNSFQPSQLPSRFAGLTCSSRRRDGGNPPLNPKKNNKKKIAKKEVGEDDDLDEDAFEALFRQLEEDLKNDELDGEEDDQDVSEEDLAKLEKELAEALEDDDFLVALGSAALGGVIKKLAADLCMDRAVVLKLLRDPPPDLVILSATLPDKPTKRTKDPVEKQEEPVALETTAKTIKDPVEKQEEPVETTKDAEKPKVEAKAPVHVMQSNWTARKRLKKVHIETLEEVYRRSKRPTVILITIKLVKKYGIGCWTVDQKKTSCLSAMETSLALDRIEHLNDAMISSIVHVTNLPRKRIVKWFEDKREEDGVPEQRVPYEPRASESTITTN